MSLLAGALAWEGEGRQGLRNSTAGQTPPQHTGPPAAQKSKSGGTWGGGIKQIKRQKSS